jgi:two-component system chemotaxis response regulator CheY
MPIPKIGKHAILVADPDQHLSAMVSGMLRGLHYGRIDTASNSNAALLLLQSRKFSVILVADGLEPFDGIAFTRTMRGFERLVNRDTPVIMMSTAPSAELIKTARDAGITEFLRRPFAPEHLKARIDSVLATPRAFVTAESYAGPDRRRRIIEFPGSERRNGGSGA